MNRKKYSQTAISFGTLAIILCATVFTVPKTTQSATLFKNDTPKEVIPQESIQIPSHDIILHIGNTQETLSPETMQQWIHLTNAFEIDPNYRQEIESSHICAIKYWFCDLAISTRTRESLRNTTTFSLNKDALISYLETLRDKTKKEPVDAKFSVENGKVTSFSLSQDGSQIDVPQSADKLADLLSSTQQSDTKDINLPLQLTSPKVASQDASKLGIVELIGEGRTNFSGSPKNRIHNFKRAMEQFNGAIIAPQEEFSFVKLLGDVDGEHGYLPELVIKNNKTEPEFGGGICQVSSTVFRAAIYSGLKITARRNHAYPVKYYTPYGMDATIYIPKPDLSFVNTTPGSILMQGSIEGNELIFRFYGTSDGRKTEIDGPHILERNPDGSMKTTFTQKVTDANGNTILKDEFKSSYKSPSLFPHPGQEPIFTEKPRGWSEKQWSEYKAEKRI